VIDYQVVFPTYVCFLFAPKQISLLPHPFLPSSLPTTY
jgi:hypothetical protein